MEINLLLDDPVALYNVDKKELIGVFINVRAASKYIHDHDYCIKEKTLRLSMLRKAKFESKKLGCTVTLRIANTKQKEFISKEPYIIFPGYPKLSAGLSIAKEFDSSKLSMAVVMNANSKYHVARN